MIELLVTIGIIAILMAILLPAIQRARKTSRNVTCLSKLHQLTGAFQAFANSNNNYFPNPPETQMSWESSLLPFVTPQTFQCPADGELFAATGSSYDWRDMSNPKATLAGKMITQTSREDIVLVYEQLPDWHNKGKMNAAMLDGSAKEMSTKDCLNDLLKPVNKRLAKKKLP